MFGRALAVVSWICLGVGLVEYATAPAHVTDAVRQELAVPLAIFFLTLIARLILAAQQQPRRRRSLWLLVAALSLWACGSSVLDGVREPDLASFPAPGEWLFLAAYAGIAGYLIVDRGWHISRAAGTWLETIVVCGGSACLAGSLLLTPAATAFGHTGLPLFLGLLYPLIDIILGLLVIAQAVLRTSGKAADYAGLLLGFALFAVADVQFLVHISARSYDYDTLSIACWGLGLAGIVSSACRPRTISDRGPSGRGMGMVVVFAGVAPAIVLAFQPDGTVRNYLTVPALATLFAGAARLALALRAANRAAEAFALSRSDDLTALPNRRAVLGLLDQTLATTDPLALMILDLDGFKDVNDTLGHGAGDTVLREMATRMREVLDPKIMVARLGGDEFAIVAGDSDEISLMETAQTILRAIRTPVEVEGVLFATDASIGITIRGDTDAASSELLRRADVAMYHAKRDRIGVILYNPDTDDFSREKLQVGEQFRRAIVEHQLVLWYQPQIDASTQQVCGLEALIRWNHPERGVLSPVEFLPAARRAGLMQMMSEEISRIAVNDLIRWRANGVSPRVAINCAPPELMSGIFLADLYDRLKAARIPPSSVVIEVTEDSFIAEPERARMLLLDIRKQGFQVSIDDYGTGFSSLSYLRDLPVQELKMDRSFIATMRSDPRSRMIVSSTFQMAAALGLRSVAEGIEDAATAADLVAMGVDVLQGYHLSRPLPPEQVERWIANRTAMTQAQFDIATDDR